MPHLSAKRAISAFSVAAALFVPTTAAAAPTPSTTSLQQHAVVSWKKGKSAGKDRSTFSIPGIGYGEIVCRTDATHIRIYPNDLTRETSMWSVVQHQTGEQTSSWAVKNARIFTFATPTTPQGATGTGSSAQEGFNHGSPIEDSGSGLVYGLISQRSAFNQPASQTAPTTSFTLSWKWSGFQNQDTTKRKCKVEALFFTTMPDGKKFKTKKVGGTTRGPGFPAAEALVDWHGEADAGLGKTGSSEVQLPGIGVLKGTCSTGRDSVAALTVTRDTPATFVTALVETYEGSSTEQPTPRFLTTDPLTGVLRIPLPTNAFLRIVLTTADGKGSQLYVSTWRQTNDEKPAENFCEIAAQAITPTGGTGDSGPIDL